MIVQTLEHGKKVVAHILEQVADSGKEFQYVAVDTETVGMPEWAHDKKAALLIGRATIVTFSICYQQGAYSFFTDRFLNAYPTIQEWKKVVLEPLRDAGLTFVFHNANYDLNVFHFDAGFKIPKYRCTMIGSWCAAPWLDKSLKDLAPLFNRFLNQTSTIDFTNKEDLGHYAEQDVVVTEELHLAQTVGDFVRYKDVRVVAEDGNLVDYTDFAVNNEKETVSIKVQKLSPFMSRWEKLQEIPFLRCTQRGERRGIPFDVKRLQKIRKIASRVADDLLKRIYRITGKEFNLNSSQQIGAVMTSLNLESPEKTKTGAPSYGAKALHKMVEMHPIVPLIIEYRGIAKLSSVYVGKGGAELSTDKGLEHFVVPGKGFIRSTVNTVGAVTGRTSSSNPNLQQIPSRKDTLGIKGCFVGGLKFDNPFGKIRARSRQVICLDYSQLEIRVMAIMSNDPRMLEVLRDPEGDIHQVTQDEFNVNRVEAKQINFLMQYGGGEYMLAEQLTFSGVPTTPELALTYKTRYEEVYARVPEFRKKLLEDHQANNYILNMFGRPRHLPDVDWNNRWARHKAETTLSNNVIQSSGQDMLKAAIIRCDYNANNPDRHIARNPFRDTNLDRANEYAEKLEKARRTLRRAKAVYHMQVHDECIFTADRAAAEEAAHVIADIMCWRHFIPSRLAYSVPIEVDGGVADTWGQAKKKPEIEIMARGDYDG